MIRLLKMWAGLLVAAAVVACGGGGGSAGTNPNNPAPIQVAADFEITLDKTTIAGNGSDAAILTVTALDKNRNVVPNEPVTVSINNNGVFVPAAAATDVTGKLVGTITSGSDPAARTMTVSVLVNGVTKTATVAVQQATQPGAVKDYTIALSKGFLNTSGTDSARLTIVVLDGNNNVVANVPVTVAVNNGAVFVPDGTVTDASGSLTGTITAGTNLTARDITITATVNGIVKTATLPVTQSQSDFVMSVDRTTILNTGLDTAQLTVTALDASRNVVVGAPVSVTVDQNGVFTPTAGGTTDGSGIYKGTISIGSDKRDRDITVRVTIGGLQKTTSVHVAGTKIQLQATPNAPSPGQTVTMSATVLDAANNPIPNAFLRFGGSVPALANVTGTTSLSGQVTTSFVAPTTPAFYTINATSNGVTSSDYQLQVFSTTIPTAIIPAGSTPSLSASPNVLAVNAPGSTANKSTLRFLFLDSSNNPVQNVRVRFQDATVGLSAVGASISSGTQTLFTDVGGVATAEYIAGQNSSPTNGVTVKACYKATDFTSATDCPASVTATMTVAGQALSVSIGDNNLMEPGINSLTYIKRFAVTVADSAGRAVANAPVDISVDLTHYGKGFWQFGYQDPFGNTYEGLDLAVVPSSLTTAYPSDTTNPSTLNQRVWCPNEDTNRNGNVDPGENKNGSTDSNGQPTLEPRKSDLIISYDNPAVTTTNANGVLVIKVEYSQRFGSWLAYKVRVTANVQGSQGMAERLFVTGVLEGDVDNGSFRTPPYGVGSCRAAN